MQRCVWVGVRGGSLENFVQTKQLGQRFMAYKYTEACRAKAQKKGVWGLVNTVLGLASQLWSDVL